MFRVVDRLFLDLGRWMFSIHAGMLFVLDFGPPSPSPGRESFPDSTCMVCSLLSSGIHALE